jgi:signal transduction histidine kinase
MLEACERDRETRAHRRLDDALRSSRSKTQLVAALGHDLRQPLTVLMATLEVLEPDLPPVRSPVLERAQAAAARLDRAGASAMDAARLELGEIKLRIYPFRVDPLLREVCDQHALDAERKGLRLTMVPCRHEVVSDPEVVGSILHKLVDNAIKFAKAGKVLLGCRRRAADLSIQVVDTGIGIPQESSLSNATRIYSTIRGGAFGARKRKPLCGRHSPEPRRAAEQVSYRAPRS